MGQLEQQAMEAFEIFAVERCKFGRGPMKLVEQVSLGLLALPGQQHKLHSAVMRKRPPFG
jgi:hypothetical protein